MKVDILLITLLIYIFVFFKKIYRITNIANIVKEKENKKNVMRHLILDAFLWPITSVSRYSPLEAISLLFFKRYGEKGNVYFGSKGLRNFLYDVFKGRNRYASLNKIILVFELEKDCRFFKENPICSDMAFARVFIGMHKTKYMYHAVLSSIKPPDTLESISRYEIDDCCKLDMENLIEELAQYTKDPEVFSALETLK